MDAIETDGKLCGVLSTHERAQAAREQLMEVEGFRDHPDDFLIDEYDVDRVQWESGFVSLGLED